MNWLLGALRGVSISGFRSSHHWTALAWAELNAASAAGASVAAASSGRGGNR